MATSENPNFVELHSREEEVNSIEESSEDEMDLSIKFIFPKFSKGFQIDCFEDFIKEFINTSDDQDNLTSIGRLAYPNEFQMSVNTTEIRERLVRLGRTKINGRTCWIRPLNSREIRGFIHWFPVEISNEEIQKELERYGKVIFIENQKDEIFTNAEKDSRYFAMKLDRSHTIELVPHFKTLHGYRGLITITGRKGQCIHCKKIGHRKDKCPKYREKLKEYCERPHFEGNVREKPRGRRYKQTVTEDLPEDEQDVKRSKKKRNRKKANNTITGETVPFNAEILNAMSQKQNKITSDTEDVLPEDHQPPAEVIDEELAKKIKSIQLNFEERMCSATTELTQHFREIVAKMMNPAISAEEKINFLDEILMLTRKFDESPIASRSLTNSEEVSTQVIERDIQIGGSSIETSATATGVTGTDLPVNITSKKKKKKKNKKAK